MLASAYLPPPLICEQLQSIVARSGGDWVQSTPRTKLEYAVPPIASEEVRQFFLRQNASAEFSEQFIGRLPGGRVFGSGAVLSPDGKSVARDVSVDFGKSVTDHWLLGYRRIRPPVIVGGTTAVVATALGTGYAHWLLEELPRLLVLRCSESDTLVAHARSSFSRETLRNLGVLKKVLEPRRYSHFSCEQLIVPSLIGQPGYPTPHVGELLHDFAARFGDGERKNFGERLYISREKARRRRVTNHVEIWPWLHSRGFQEIHTEDLTVAQQISAFRGAKVIVAPHGAGLANIVFCRQGTQIVEAFNRSYVNGGYCRLAGVQGLDYRPVVTEGCEPLAVTLSANPLPINIKPSCLKRALSD